VNNQSGENAQNGPAARFYATRVAPAAPLADSTVGCAVCPPASLPDARPGQSAGNQAKNSSLITRASACATPAPLLSLACPLAGLTFIDRLVCALISAKVSDEMRRHPVAHWAWGGFAFVGSLFLLGVRAEQKLESSWCRRTIYLRNRTPDIAVWHQLVLSVSVACSFDSSAHQV